MKCCFAGELAQNCKFSGRVARVEEALKKQELRWSLVILVLIGLAVYTLVGKHYDAKTHRIVANYPIRYGLDIKGGVRAVLQARTDKMAPGVVYDGPTVLRILENRVNGAGVGEATVQRKGDTQFIIELPDVKDKNAILERLGTTAQMTFYYFRDVQSPRDPGQPIVMQTASDAQGNETYTFQDKRTGQTFRDGSHVRKDFTSLLGQGTDQRPGATLFAVPAPLSASLPAGTQTYFTPAQQAQAQALNKELVAWNAFIADSPVILSGADILPKSSAHMGGQLGTDPSVSQVFTPKGASAFADFTRNHTKEFNGVVLDDQVITAPIINEPILDGQAEVSGGFKSLAEAQALANLINAGALPVPLEQVQTESVEASLGTGAVAKSVTAGLVGLTFVLLFMLLYYRLPGLVADVALLIYALFVLAIFRGGLGWLGVPAITLTLPGIAGFILSIGMAVDANILIFERLKEELRAGKSLRGAIDAGFRRAFTAIRDSNICTAITCIVLLTLGTASVRGFALTLLIGVLVSLFSAITVTRTLLYLLVDAGIGNNPALFGLNVRSLGGRTAAGDTVGTRGNINIIGRRRFFYGISALIIVPGLIFLAMGGLKKSIEFTGGTQIEVKYRQPVTALAVENAISAAGYHKPHIQLADGGTSAIVSVQKQSPVVNPALSPVHQQLAAALNTLGPNTEQQFGNVGGVISAELTSRAIQAVIIASLLIVLYLATVFGVGGFVAGLRLGTSSIAALLHDVLVLVGAFAIFGYFLGWEIDSLFVTALLTVIGFSVHDTVVIFDRVRENQRHKARGEAFEPLVNRSINQTLARSVNTSLTVIMTLVALVVLGGQTTRLLNVALLIGIISGTYSSIFNAASILVDWENWLAKRRANRPVLATVSPATASILEAGNGGSARALPSAERTVATTAPRPAEPLTRPSRSTETDATRIRPKKKGPTRRF